MCVLFCADEVPDPAHLPGVNVFLRVVAFKPRELAEGILPGLENALIDWRARGERDPWGIGDIGQYLRGVVHRRGNIQKPCRSGQRVANSRIRGLQQRVRTPIAVLAKISTDNGVGIGLEIGVEVARVKLIASSPEVSPETLGNMSASELPGEHGIGLFPLRQSSGTIAPLVIRDGKTVIDFGTIGRKLERVVIVGNSVSPAPA